jgi:hypothetical protein
MDLILEIRNPMTKFKSNENLGFKYDFSQLSLIILYLFFKIPILYYTQGSHNA